MKLSFWDWLDDGLPAWYAQGTGWTGSRVAGLSSTDILLFWGDVRVQSFAWRGVPLGNRRKAEMSRARLSGVLPVHGARR